QARLVRRRRRVLLPQPAGGLRAPGAGGHGPRHAGRHLGRHGYCGGGGRCRPNGGLRRRRRPGRCDAPSDRGSRSGCPAGRRRPPQGRHHDVGRHRRSDGAPLQRGPGPV
ncbi:uncharacterized protein METZ01_LOCUS131809, partial [marine metagenome]